MEYSHSTGTYSSTNPPAPKGKKRSKNKRRFSDEQIKSLESMFETDSKLEPAKKLQLARELGLQPRQVAIWFQNKRARWKLKQLQRDNTVLAANYNSLASRFDALKKDNQTLLAQLQNLNVRIQKPPEQTQSCTTAYKATNGMDSESENGDTIKISEQEVKPSQSTERSEHVLGGVHSDGDSSIKAAEEYFGVEDEPGHVNFVEHVDGSLTSSEDWSMFGSNDILGQSPGDYEWWDFWS